VQRRRNGAATDTLGNVYVAGKFTGGATFGTTNLVDAGSGDVFVAKYDPEGNLLWAKRAGGTAVDEATGIATDAAGNAYVTGQFTGTAGFGTFTLVSAGSQDIFVAKYDTAGTVLWASRAGGTSFEEGLAVAANASGAVVVTGFFRETASFGAATLVSAGNADIFVAGYSTTGTNLWAKRAGSTDGDVGQGVCLDESGRSVVTGSITNDVQFGSTTLTNAGERDVFIVSYDASGNVLWAKQAGGASHDVGHAIAMDGLGNAVVSGYFVDSADFGSNTLTDAGGGDIFFAKYNAIGEVTWAGRAGGGNFDRGLGIATDGQGNAVITGAFRETADFGSVNLTSAGRDDIFVAKVSSAGGVLWAWGAGTGGDDRGFGVATDPSGNVFGTGTFGGTIDILGTSLESAGASDVFVFKAEPDGS
jgi:hypothetical protein